VREEKKKAKRSAKIAPQNLNFQEAAATPLPMYQTVHPMVEDRCGYQVMETPKNNIAVAKRILDQDQDLDAIYKVHYLLSTALD
jgi:hypothetical protein